MSQLTTLLHSLLAGSLGNAGAVANAATALDARVREDWVIDGLARRLDPAAPPATLPSQPARIA